MRRTTLGPLSSGDLNRSLDDSISGLGTSRRSMGASGLFGGSKAVPGSSRKQVPDRRESMHAKADFGMRLVGAPLADPRNVTSRKFMDDSVKQLSEFLASTGYMGEVTPARLLSPTSASFRSVMVHLLKMLDASYVVGPPDKFADEVQSVFKALRYPFPISKTAITAAGAQQSWPTLLSAIMWFVSLLKYGELATAEEEAGGAGGLRGAEDDAASSSREFVQRFLGQGYALFMQEKDDELAVIKSSMAEAFGEQHASLEAENNRVAERNAALQRELDELTALQSRLPEATAHKAELTEEVGLKRVAMQEMQAWVGQLGAKMAEVKRDLALKEQELHRYEAAQQQLERRLETQEIQPADVERMARRKAQLREDTAKAHADARAAADRALAMGQDVKAALERLRSATAEYNSAATRLQVAPVGAKYSQGQDFLLRINDAFLASVTAAAAGKGGVEGSAAGAATSAALLSTDVKGVVKFGLREMKAKLARTVADAGRSGLELDSDLANLAEARAEATKKIDGLTRRLREREDAVGSYRSEMEQGLHTTDREIGDLTDRVAALRTELIAAQAAARELGPEVLRGLELQISTQVGALRSQRARYLQSVNAALTAVGHHKSLTEAKMQELAARAAETARAVSARAPPSAVPPPLAPQAAAPPKHAGSSSSFIGGGGHATLPPHSSGAASYLREASSGGRLAAAAAAPTPLGRPAAGLHSVTAAAPAAALVTPPAPPPASEGRFGGGASSAGTARMSLSAGPALAHSAGGGSDGFAGRGGGAALAPEYDSRAWAPAVPRALLM